MASIINHQSSETERAGNGLSELHEAQAAIFKALGHPTRVEIVDMLATEGGMCVSEIVDRMHFDQSTVSKHLALLKAVGIVRCSKEGLNVTYEINMKCVSQFLRCVETVVNGQGADKCGGMCSATEGRG